MAVLLKSQLDSKAKADSEKKKTEREALISKANYLREELGDLVYESKDLTDTFKYYTEKMDSSKVSSMKSKFKRGYDFTFDRERFKFEEFKSGSIGIDCQNWCDYQHLYCIDGVFHIHCVDSFNGSKSKEILEYVDFEKRNDYYIKQAIWLMNEYLNGFQEFYDKFVSFIQK